MDTSKTPLHDAGITEVKIEPAKIMVPVTVEVTEQKLSDLMCSAFEGGSKQVHNDTHIARKPWGRTLKSGLRYIMPGDKYVKYVTKHWRHNGPSWFTERRLRLEPSFRN